MRNLFAACLGAAFFLTANVCYAQSFMGGELERNLRPGTNFPYDGMPWSHRYNYDFGPIFYPSYNAKNLVYLEYLDRVDRAEKFGYATPRDPFGHDTPQAPTGVAPYPTRGLLGFGLFRRH